MRLPTRRCGHRIKHRSQAFEKFANLKYTSIYQLNNLGSRVARPGVVSTLQQSTLRVGKDHQSSQKHTWNVWISVGTY